MLTTTMETATRVPRTEGRKGGGTMETATRVPRTEGRKDGGTMETATMANLLITIMIVGQARQRGDERTRVLADRERAKHRMNSVVNRSPLSAVAI